MNRYRQMVAELVPLGFTVLPAGCHKHPIVEWKEYQGRKPTRMEYGRWMARHPDANGAILTGELAGMFVVDADSLPAMAWLESKGMPRSWTARTRKGRHYYFRWPAMKVWNSAGKLHEGVDIRGEGGAVVAPGSRHATGFVYRWEIGPSDASLAEAPGWLLGWLCDEMVKRTARLLAMVEPKPFRGAKGAWATAIVAREIEALRLARAGTRNESLNVCAFRLGQLVGAGEVEEAEIEAALMHVAEGWPEARKNHDTILRGINAGAAFPRGYPRSRVIRTGWFTWNSRY